MTKKEIIEEIEEKIIDVIDTDFEFHDTKSVPNSDDKGLSFEYGDTKKGKTIETCVLYVDIRDSVALTKKHDTETMGKVYTAFTKAVILSAQHHSGYIRNIIGDRVMVVFEPEDCFTNAVDCAITINHISKYVINEKFEDVNFKCGIGIDYGEFNVLKVGIAKQGDERDDNKNLVWVGEPANLASRLTDVANKKIDEIYFEVKRKPRPVFSENFSKINYISKIDKLNAIDFAKIITSGDSKIIYIKNLDKIESFTQKHKTYSIQSVLMTRVVYDGFENENPNRKSIVNNLWKELDYLIKNVTTKVYGGNIIWEI